MQDQDQNSYPPSWPPRWKSHAGHWRPHRWGRGPKAWRKRGGFIFLRFASIFGFMALLIAGGMGALAYLLTSVFGGDRSITLLVWFGGCGLSLALPLLAVGVAVRAFRGIASPLGDLMEAADALAEGDLNVRVPEHRPGEFGQLSRSFNRMAEELERAEQQRRNLTADVAHELRTPLHILQGNLEGILDRVYEPTDAQINAMLDETRSLSRLVEDLQTLSLAEAGQLTLVWEDVNLGELLTDVHTSFTGQAEAAGIDLILDVDDTHPSLTIRGDYGRLDQVFSNLVVNALRHTPEGGKIQLSVKPQVTDVKVSVTDNGQGIPQEDLPYIFDRFWRGDRSRTRSPGSGSGLGLAIARQLVQAHGGQISVKSQPGTGTTFNITIPNNQAKTFNQAN